MIKDEPYDPARMRQGMWDAFRLKDPRFIFTFRCAWCEVGMAKDRFHPHHALVKSSQVRHWAVDNALENRVPLCGQCHDAHGQSSEMIVKALDYLIDRLGAERVARWYISLWDKHGLSVVRGTLPELALRYQCAWCEYESDRDGICPNDDILCRDENHQLQRYIDLDADTADEWRDYLELVCLPLCCAA